MKDHCRQGDLLIVRVDEIPAETDTVQGNVMLAGQVTGHSHRLVHGEAPAVAATHLLSLAVTTQASLVHEEHRPITLPPGRNQVRRQRAYHPQTIRTVVD